MGTNYYFYPKGEGKCECCDQSKPRLHIGKSSAGWCFSLHVQDPDNSFDDPIAGIHNLSDWVLFIVARPSGVIKNEYDEIITIDKLTDEVTRRNPGSDIKLKRHDIDGSHCIGHGESLYDLIVGEFS